MRNPARIGDFVAAIGNGWENRCPDWRFSQLMINFLGWLGRDPFYMEDDEFLVKFEEFLDTI